MKNKKIIVVVTSMILSIGGILFVNQIYNKSKNKHIPKRNNLAIMVKGESGEYVSTDAIPKGNYILNEDKTICENNGKVLNYDSTTGKVSFSFVGSDRCSLYFDKIIDTEKPVISNLVVNDTTVTAILTDNIELSSYGISASNTVEPSSWTTISGTTYNFSTTINTEGTYYLWVKDTSGNMAKKEFTITPGTSFDNLMIANNTDIFNENGLRYEGAAPNNYICLDSNKEGVCSSSSLLFRIIGLFDEEYSTDGTNSAGTMKLLKILDTNNYGGTSGKYWNQTQATDKNLNDWSTATLKTELNGTYLTTLLGTSNVNSKLNSAIVSSKWHLGGANETSESSYYYHTITTENWYKVERSPYATSGTLQNLYSGNPEYIFAKVGLMYPSDYGYASVGGNTTSKANCRAKELYNWSSSSYSDCKNNDWIFKSQSISWGSNKSEWLISPNALYSPYASYLYSTGSAYIDSSVRNNQYAVRPTFYLNSNILKIVGGTGTSTDPYHIG